MITIGISPAPSAPANADHPAESQLKALLIDYAIALLGRLRRVHGAVEELKHLITHSFEESNGTYGYRRVHADLAEWGVPCGPELVRACGWSTNQRRIC